MALLNDLGTYLASALSLTVGTDLFLGSMPDSPHQCVTVYEYGGLAPEHTLGTDSVMRRPRVQITCRGPIGDYATPRTQADAAYTAMQFGRSTLTGTVYYRSEALDEPFPLERDQNDRWIIACNFQVWRA